MKKSTRTLWHRLPRLAIFEKILGKKTPPPAEPPESELEKKVLPDKEKPKEEDK